MRFTPAEFLETTRITRVAGEPFKTTGKVLVKPGWLAVHGKDAAGEERLIPAAQELLAEVDIEGRRIVIEIPAGLLDAE